MSQRHSVEKLHDYEGLPLVLANFVNRANVRMVQSGSGTSFTAEAFERLWVFGEVLGQELQGDEPAQLSVLSLVNHTHPAAAELFEDAVVGDGLTEKCVSLRHSPAILG